MPEDNILVAIHRDDARELLLERGWEQGDALTRWIHPQYSKYEWSLEGALHIALADEAKTLREQAKA